MVKIKILLVATGFLFSCSSIFRWFDEPLTLERQEYIGQEIRTDGYFYRSYMPGYYDFMFFYKDGVFYTSSAEAENISALDAHIFKVYSNRKSVKSSTPPDGWGLFKIEGKGIEINRWHTGDGGRKAGGMTGAILNDSTIEITRRHLLYDISWEKEVNEQFNFRSFPIKKDSLGSPFFTYRKYKLK